MKFLEYLACRESKKSVEYIVEENKTVPKSNNLPEHQQAVVEEFFENIRFLSSYIGVGIFDQIQKMDRESNQKIIFECKRRKSCSKGYINDDSFNLLKGSKIIKSVTNSFSQREFEQRQEKILKFTRQLDEEFL